MSLWGFTSSGGGEQVDSFKPSEKFMRDLGGCRKGNCSIRGLLIYVNQPHLRQNENCDRIYPCLVSCCINILCP